MKTITKKVLSIVTAVLMLLCMTDLSMFPKIDLGITAAAEESDVIEISTADELVNFRERVNNDETSLNAVLTADIDLSGVCGDCIGNWTPIGDSYSNRFTGTFDGNEHTISGLYINNSDFDYQGLFGYIGESGLHINNSESDYQGLFGYIGENGTVKNVTVYGSVTGGYYVGSVCGINDGKIKNCYNTGYVTGYQSVGGVCGMNCNGTIENCYNTGTVTGSGYYVGGVCGLNVYGTIENCYNTGVVTGNVNVGGVCGQNDGTIDNCYNTGYVKGYDYVGSVCGYNHNGTVDNCYNAGTVTGNNRYVGGVCGYNNNGTINNCYNTGTVTGGFVGGVCGYNDNGTVDNCSNTGDVTGDYYVGGVCGCNYDGTIENCYNTGDVSSKGDDVSDVGGVCGYNSGTIKNCYNTGTVSGKGDVGGVGGVCGYNYDGTIDNCYNTGDVSGKGDDVSDVGGVCGDNYGTINNCYNTGDVTGSDYVGGVCGYNNNGTIKNCYNAGAVTGKGDVGGVCGYNDNGTVDNCYNTGNVTGDNCVGGVCGCNGGTIENCYNAGTVTGNNRYVGGVCGLNNHGTIENCYYLNTCVADSNATSKTAGEFKSGEVCYLLNGSSSENVSWYQDIGDSENPYPHFVNNGENTVYHLTDGTYANKPQLIEDVYQIKSASQLLWFAGLVNGTLDGIAKNTAANAVLTADIDLSGVCHAETSEGAGDAVSWTPIGNYSNKFTGTFDGGGHTISGLYINNSGSDYQGLFGYIGENGTVENVTVYGSVTGNSYVGGVCGKNYGTIENCYNTGKVTGTSSCVGGVCGYNDIGTISNCCNTGTVEGSVEGSSCVGSVCGYNHNGTVDNCYNTGNVTGDDCVGGVCGCNGGTIENCYNAGTVTGNNRYVGGVCGLNNHGTIENCYNTGDVSGKGDDVSDVGGVCGYNDNGTVDNCYNTGDVSGKGDVGGVCGDNYGTINNCYNTGDVEGNAYVGGVCGINYGTIENCYNTGDVTGSDYVGGVCGYNYDIIENCYNTGKVTGSDNYVGGVCGENYEGTINNCYYLNACCEGSTDFGKSKTAEQFASGEVAYLLGTAFGQTLNKEDYPVFGGQKVYAGYLKCGDTQLAYSNSAEELRKNSEHDYGTYRLCVYPTCTENGKIAKFCKYCNDEVAIEFDPLGHSYEYTESENGKHTAKCTRCDESHTEGCTYKNGECIKCGGKQLYTVTVKNGTITKGTSKKGNIITVTADENTSEAFAYWTDSDGKITSYKSSYSFVVTGDTTITAIYTENSVEKFGTVSISSVVQDFDNKKLIVKSASDVPEGFKIVFSGVLANNTKDPGTTYDYGTSNAITNGTYVRGITATTSSVCYTWTKANISFGDTWYLRAYLVYEDGNGTKHTVYGDLVKSIFDYQYEVSVTNGTGAGTYYNGDIVTIKADDAQDRMQFAGWLDNNTEKIVSYNTNYSFIVNGNCSFTAQYSAEEVEKLGTAEIKSVTKDTANNKLSFVSFCNVPEDCSIVFAGVVAKNGEDPGTDTDFGTLNAKIDNTFVRGFTTAESSASFTWTKTSVSDEDTWYVRAYLVYTDSNKETKTVFGDVVATSLNG